MLRFQELIDKDQFTKLRFKYPQIPLVKKLPDYFSCQDLWRLGTKKQRVILESSLSTNSHRYSYFSPSFTRKIEIKDNSSFENGQDLKLAPLDLLNLVFTTTRAPRWQKEAPNFCGGWICCFAYEASRYLQKPYQFKNQNENETSIYLAEVKDLFIFDEIKKDLYAVSLCSDYDAGLKCIDKLTGLVNKAKKQIVDHPQLPEITSESVKSSLTQSEYLKNFDKIRDFITRGESYQLNFAQRYSLKFNGDPFRIYRTLTKINPVPFSAILEFGDTTIISGSQERLVNRCHKTISSRPIAGTRRSGSLTEVKAFIKELASDSKEISEHSMLVDLVRNDLGKVCKYNSIKVKKFMDIVPYRYVIHIESDIVGQIKENLNSLDVFKALFPGGTITGVPKTRTMELIDEVESCPRSIYTGSLGYVSSNGDCDFNIMIRSILCENGLAHTWAGGGLVYDSIAKREWKEVFNKAKPQLQAIISTGGESL